MEQITADALKHTVESRINPLNNEEAPLDRGRILVFSDTHLLSHFSERVHPSEMGKGVIGEVLFKFETWLWTTLSQRRTLERGGGWDAFRFQKTMAAWENLCMYLVDESKKSNGEPLMIVFAGDIFDFFHTQSDFDNAREIFNSLQNALLTVNPNVVLINLFGDHDFNVDGAYHRAHEPEQITSSQYRAFGTQPFLQTFLLGKNKFAVLGLHSPLHSVDHDNYLRQLWLRQSPEIRYAFNLQKALIEEAIRLGNEGYEIILINHFQRPNDKRLLNMVQAQVMGHVHHAARPDHKWMNRLLHVYHLNTIPFYLTGSVMMMNNLDTGRGMVGTGNIGIEILFSSSTDDKPQISHISPEGVVLRYTDLVRQKLGASLTLIAKKSLQRIYNIVG